MYSGATDHFIAINATFKNSWPTPNSILVVIPDGRCMSSTKERDLDWPVLPQETRQGHIIPSLKNHTLIFVVKLCNARCDVIFRHNCCLVVYKGKIIMYCVWCPQTQLWMVPLSTKTQHKPLKCDITLFNQQYANSIHHMANQHNLIGYLHQRFFSPRASTLVKLSRMIIFLVSLDLQ